MNSVQESKNELEASIRYAENAISSAKQTIESMEFRQEMAQKQFSEQTGREQALQAQVALLEERIADTQSDMVGDASTIKTLKEEREMLEKNVKYLRDENERLNRDVEAYTKEYNKLVQQKEASSGPCGCQAYRDLEERADSLAATTQRLKRDQPTMPVIPKDVAIAIFREGVAHGVSNACDELDNSDSIEISETGYTGDFEVSFSKYIDLTEHIDLDWLRSEVGVNDEADVIEALKNLCADKEFECRIYGVDDQEEKKND